MLKGRPPFQPIRAAGLLLGPALAALALFAAPASGQNGEESFTTTFATDNSFAGNTFDLEIKPPGGLEVESLDVHLSGPVGNNATVEVWTRPGTAVGFEQTLDGWTSRGSRQVSSAGTGNPTPLPVSFSLRQGTHGVAVGVTDYPSVSMLYTNGANVFDSDVLTFTSGAGLGNPVLEGLLLTPRTWNGTIHYSTPSQECRSLEARWNSAEGEYKLAGKAFKKAKKQVKKAKASGKKQKIKKAKKKLRKKKQAKKRAKSDRNDAQASYEQACT